MRPKSDQVFVTSQAGASPLDTGEEFLLTYRTAPVKMWFSSKARQEAFNSQMDPLTVLNSKTHDYAASEKFKELKKETRGWKVAHIPLLPSATK